MRYVDLFELKNEAAWERTFNLLDVENRRFMFDPASRKFIVGDVEGAGRGRNIRSSHAQEYFDVTGSNVGFDKMIRGWMGTSRQYLHGVIHFAPEIFSGTLDAGFKCLAAFKKCGASADTIVRGFPGAWEQRLGDILP